jgi:signal transduction histidine kinase
VERDLRGLRERAEQHEHECERVQRFRAQRVAGGDHLADRVAADEVAEQQHAREQRQAAGAGHEQREARALAALRVAADCGLVDILVSNLVRNAFSYTTAGSVTVRQDSHSLVISDTGRGISADAIDQAFLRHFRDITSTGAGIGLSLVKRICDRYGWQVRLESTEHQGTTGTVTFAR